MDLLFGRLIEEKQKEIWNLIEEDIVKDYVQGRLVVIEEKEAKKRFDLRDDDYVQS